jgi:Glycyl-tRNA synthetase, beta subunit
LPFGVLSQTDQPLQTQQLGLAEAFPAILSEPDAFFDGAPRLVNAEDVALRNNRLGLLATLHQTMNRVADLSKLAA